MAPKSGAGYAMPVGMVYCFNLMMGAGLLALPHAFVQEGWITGLVGIIILAFMSYSTVSFLIETQSVHNALLNNSLKERKDNKTNRNKQEIELQEKVVENKNADQEEDTGPDGSAVANGHAEGEMNNNVDTTMVNNNSEAPDDGETNEQYRYEITTKTELGELCKLFLNKFGYALYYIAITLYLFGSLSIYCAAISKSIASIVCDDQEGFQSNNSTLPCKRFPKFPLMQMYRLSLAAFVVLCTPFAFFTLTKTKLLQLSTMAFRCIALTSMIVLALLKIIKGEGNPNPKLYDVKKLPDFISTSIYAFMCQYSVPAVVTPIRNKKRVQLAVALDFGCVVLFYASILMTSAYAFKDNAVQDVYTLSFTHPAFFKYLLELFPILTLAANFPVVAIVLRDNIKKLFLTKDEKEYGFFLRRILFPVIAITPPIVISSLTYDVGMLVGYTGAYAGAIIQYVVPVLLIYCARKKAVATFGDYDNKYSSPLKHNIWLILVLAWYVVSLVFVTYSKAHGFTGGA